MEEWDDRLFNFVLRDVRECAHFSGMAESSPHQTEYVMVAVYIFPNA